MGYPLATNVQNETEDFLGFTTSEREILKERNRKNKQNFQDYNNMF
jgi:hypothetical protein